jgi:hypothetical protein
MMHRARSRYDRDMTDSNGNATKLTGVWQGLYTYGRRPEQVSFVATLIESGSSVSGSIHEPCVGEHCPADTLYATLEGSRQDSAVAFVKTYDVPGPAFREAVLYEGTLSADATEIEGVWNIQGLWFGKFLMIRSSGQSATASRKISVRV